VIREPVAPAADPALRDRYVAVRAQTAALAAPLSAEDCQIQSMPDASPTKWHLAHTTWFFETFVLSPHLPGYRDFEPRFRALFNSYYNSVGEQPLRAARGLVSRPGLDVVYAYRRHVDGAMTALLEGGRLAAGVARVVELGLQHEQQHQELILTDIKHALWAQPGRPQYAAPAPPRPPRDAVPRLAWQAYEAGIVAIGHDGAGFAFDNELPHHQALVPAAALASRLVTCGEYLDFVRDGGYERPALWLAAGWEAVRAAGWHAPLYWRRQDGEWFITTLHGDRALAPAEPVCHVSFYEADAYARWAGARLPTEFEWERAARDVAGDGNFLESGALHPRPLTGRDGPAGGPAQLFGDVWEWTASPYTGYPGYRPQAGALGEYNGKFMSDQWVLRGGSCATPRAHMRATYRNFFPAATRWQFSGVRLARDAGA
jgi:ergothioneine biosynthesis protein EgtB